MMNQEPARVLHYHSNFYTVQYNGGLYQCALKGMLKKEGTLVLSGDRVTLDNIDMQNQTARITQVLIRENELTRPKVANVDGVMVVASVSNPSISIEQLDRYLTHVSLAGLPVWICLSKYDLAPESTFTQAARSIYPPVGIPVFETSIQRPESIQALFQMLKGKTIVLAGASGVGKSSLINSLYPQYNLAIGEVSPKIQRGQHTTRHVALLPIEASTFIADTPGFSYLKFDETDPKQLAASFPEFKEYAGQCRFDNCLHLEELDCSVRAHQDKIAPSRYQHYQRFQEEAKAYVAVNQSISQKEEYGYKALQTGKQSHKSILKLKEKQRDAARNTQKQRMKSWSQDSHDEEG